MNKPVDWRSITVPLDVTDIEVETHHLRRWLAFERTGQGLSFRGEMANGQQVTFQVDVVEPDVVRVRVSQDEIRDGPSDMLLPPQQDRQPSPFDITERQDVLILSTSRLRLEFPRFPWQMRVFGVEGTARAAPFFSEQCYDRAYGPYYEVPRRGSTSMAMATLPHGRPWPSPRVRLSTGLGNVSHRSTNGAGSWYSGRPTRAASAARDRTRTSPS